MHQGSLFFFHWLCVHKVKRRALARCRDRRMDVVKDKDKGKDKDKDRGRERDRDRDRDKDLRNM